MELWGMRGRNSRTDLVHSALYNGMSNGWAMIGTLPRRLVSALFIIQFLGQFKRQNLKLLLTPCITEDRSDSTFFFSSELTFEEIN